MAVPKPKTKIVGVFELVKFPHLSNHVAVAKMDTGAYSGALHCGQVKEVASDVGTVLEFYPFDQTEPIIYEEFAVRYVRSSNGVREKRYFIETEVQFAGRTYPIVLSLANRDKMKWQVLIGRKFLKQHGFIVDASKPSKYGKPIGSS